MRRLLGVVVLEVQATWRSLVPITWLRRSILAGLAIFAAGLSAVFLLMPVPETAAQALVGGLTGFATVSLGLASGLALTAAASLASDPGRARALTASPLPSTLAVWLPIAAVLATALLPLALFFSPFVVGALRIAPATGFLMLAVAAVVAATAAELALAAVLVLVRRHGRDRGSRLAIGLGVLLAFGALFGMGALMSWATDPWLLAAAIVSLLVILPPAMARTAREFAASLSRGEAPKNAPEPRWSSPPWWRIIGRSAAPWALLGMLPAALFVGLQELPLRWGAVALLVVLAVMAPFQHLLEPELQRPERWRLAPGAGAVARSMGIRVGGPVVGLAVLLTLACGWGAWAWVAAVTALAVSTPFSFAILAPLPRKLVQGVLVLTAFSTEILR